MHILIAGGTGVVGSEFLHRAVEEGHRTTAVGRRATGVAGRDIAHDLMSTPTVPPADVAVCCLGTTIAAAGSRRGFRAVDYGAVLNFAEGARAAGVSHFLAVTAVGANPGARVFYSRVKGEAERDLEALGFDRLDIAQPGLLLGDRQERRVVESWLKRIDPLTRCLLPGPLHRYAGIRVGIVAAALLALCSQSNPGVYRHKNREMERLARA